jgi:hypothetical protein
MGVRGRGLLLDKLQRAVESQIEAKLNTFYDNRWEK